MSLMCSQSRRANFTTTADIWWGGAKTEREPPQNGGRDRDRTCHGLAPTGLFLFSLGVNRLQFYNWVLLNDPLCSSHSSRSLFSPIPRGVLGKCRRPLGGMVADALGAAGSAPLMRPRAAAPHTVPPIAPFGRLRGQLCSWPVNTRSCADRSFLTKMRSVPICEAAQLTMPRYNGAATADGKPPPSG